MAREPGQGTPSPGGTLELLTLTLARPADALARAQAVLADDPGPYDASVARQAIGIVLREFGDVTAGIRELRTALRLARLAGSLDREADVLATLGVALLYGGRTAPGLAALDKAVSCAAGPATGRVLERRGIALWTVGRHREALEDLRRAVAILHGAGDTIWEARALTARGMVHLDTNATGRADADFAAAETLFAATSQELERAYAQHNRGLAAFHSGDLPAALSHLGEAARRYQLLGVPIADLSIDRCAVLRAAGLPGDALSEADAAVAELQRARGRATKEAELLLIAAKAALASADPDTALQRAEAARRLFRSQRRPWWREHATFWVLQARFAGRPGVPGLAPPGRADSVQPRRARLCRCRAGGPAGRTGGAGARPPAGRAAAPGGGGESQEPARAGLSRADGWLAEGLRAEAAGNPRRMLGACRRGFDLLDQHLLTLGATELRARATKQGSQFAELAQRHAAQAGQPRLLLQWSERWRATALATAPVRPVDDAELQADLTAVRDVTRRLEQARAQGQPAARLAREQLRLEAAVRERVMRTRGSGRLGSRDFSITQLLDELGTARLVQIVEIDGDLHLLVCGAGKVRQFAAGRLADAAREIDYARLGLSRLAHGRSPGRAGQPDGALATLAETGRRLESVLLGTAAGTLAAARSSSSRRAGCMPCRGRCCHRCATGC